jgi:hypothetical protein
MIQYILGSGSLGSSSALGLFSTPSLDNSLEPSTFLKKFLGFFYIFYIDQIHIKWNTTQNTILIYRGEMTLQPLLSTK